MLRAAILGVALWLLRCGWPGVALSHDLAGRVEPPLPLLGYLAAAAIAVALSFAFVVMRDIRAQPPESPGATQLAPPALVMGVRVIGLLGWLWVAAKTVLGGSTGTDASAVVLWVYGWVGLAMVCALVGPVWAWLDPFASLFDLGAAAARRLGIPGLQPAPYPRRWQEWPAAVGLAFFVWLELAERGGNAGAAMLAYTAVTLVAMARFGRDHWRAHGETFSVWFGTLGRLAPYVLDDPTAVRRLRRRPALTGLFDDRWSTALVALTAIGTASILYDGVSQTRLWYGMFGLPALPLATVYVATFLGLVVTMTLFVTRIAWLPAIGAGLLPIAVGYLLAHYLTYVLRDGQGIIAALSDPFGFGWDLLGTASYQPSTTWIQPSLIWSFQLLAVIGGHAIGAWVGHAVAARSRSAPQRHGIRQMPLALLMVALTTTTLWSLGQPSPSS
jgi:hypothetical protein